MTSCVRLPNQPILDCRDADDDVVVEIDYAHVVRRRSPIAKYPPTQVRISLHRWINYRCTCSCDQGYRAGVFPATHHGENRVIGTCLLLLAVSPNARAFGHHAPYFLNGEAVSRRIHNFANPSVMPLNRISSSYSRFRANYAVVEVKSVMATDAGIRMISRSLFGTS